jgi:hypothetical protein
LLAMRILHLFHAIKSEVIAYKNLIDHQSLKIN